MALFGKTDIPKGLCVLWLAKKKEIPSGWQICDGTKGTIDLRSDASKMGAAFYIVKV